MKKRLLYFYTNEATFIDKDLRFLSYEYEVTKRRFDVSKKWKLPFSLITQVFTILRFGWQSEWIVVQFGGYHSFLPCLFSRILRIRSAIVLGGYDCVSFPEIGYGAFSNKLMSPFVRQSYRLANLLIPVHEALIYKDYHYFEAQNKAQGFEAYTGKLKTRCAVVYNGYDSAAWTPGETTPKTSFISVAGGSEEKRRRIIKGIDLFINVARVFPEYTFTVVGAHHIPEDLPPNIQVLPFTKNSELKALYQTHRFYLQLSLSEGFPNSLCEAMLCGCVPVVSDVSSMPDIVQDAGYVLHKKDMSILEVLLKKAIEQYSAELSINARKRIAERFTEERRKHDLLEALSAH